jgi:hypothetical protein
VWLKAVEGLPSKCKALSSNPSTLKEEEEEEDKEEESSS